MLDDLASAHDRATTYVALSDHLLAGDLDPTEWTKRQALAEALTLWGGGKTYDLPALLILADAVSGYAYVLTGGKRFAVYDHRALARSLGGDASAASLILGLVGARLQSGRYTDRQPGDVGTGVTVTFGEDFAVESLHEWVGNVAPISEPDPVG